MYALFIWHLCDSASHLEFYLAFFLTSFLALRLTHFLVCRVTSHLGVYQASYLTYIYNICILLNIYIYIYIESIFTHTEKIHTHTFYLKHIATFNFELSCEFYFPLAFYHTSGMAMEKKRQRERERERDLPYFMAWRLTFHLAFPLEFH